MFQTTDQMNYITSVRYGFTPNPHGHPITAPKARSSKRSDGLCHAGSNVSSGTTFGNSKRKIQSTVWLCVYLSIYLSVCLYIYLNIYLFYLSIYLPTYLQYLYVCLSVYLSIYPGESWGESWDSQGMEHHGMELWDRFNTFYHGKWPFIVCELEHGHRNSECSHEKWWFSIVM